MVQEKNNMARNFKIWIAEYEKWYALILFIVFSAYGILLSKHFAVDTYMTCSHEQVTPNLQSGRWFGALIFALLNYGFKVYAGNIQQFLTIIHIILLAAAATVIFSTASDKVDNLYKKKVLCGIVLMSFCNVFYQELFFYSENGLTMGIGIVLCAMAIKFCVTINDVKRSALAFIFLSLSLGIYQAFLGIYLSWGLAIAFVNYINLRSSGMKRMWNVLLIGGAGALLNVLFLKIILKLNIAEGTDRQPSLSVQHLLNRCIELLKAQKGIWIDTYKFLPSGLLMAVIIIAVIALCRSRTMRNMRKLFFCTVGIQIAAVFAPHLLTDGLWLAQRTIIGVFAVAAAILYISCMENEKAHKLIGVMCVVILGVNLVQMQRISENHFANNRLDQANAILIEDAIEKYERENDTEIKYIAAQNDISPTWSYKGIEYVIFDTNTRAYVVDWADVELVNYYSGRQYKKVPMNETVYKNKFKDKNWDRLNTEEQLYFEGDTLYWIKY